jgi:hypothetical protein
MYADDSSGPTVVPFAGLHLDMKVSNHDERSYPLGDIRPVR